MAAKSSPANPRITAISSIALAAALVLGWYYWNAAPPQLGDNDRAFSAVDALFTAVTAKNEKLLAECGARLNSLRDKGDLNTEASVHLDQIISQAETGEWREAARRLYKFMQAQRREAI
jgi:predicted negative regulator of RcsB-dependent stress response